MDNQAGPSTSYIDGQFSTKLQSTDSDCPFNSPSYDFCGTWTRDCSAEIEFSADSTTMLLMAYEDENDGQMLMYKQYFNPDTACDEGQVQLTIEARGYYSKMVVDDQHPGVLVVYKQILVTATDQGDMVDALNDPSNGCPCGGTWEAGVKRALTQCPADTCPGNGIFGAGTLGTPGYGLMQITGGKLQMSVLQTTEADGIYPNGRYELSAFPFELDAACEPAEAETTVCGIWTQPCQSDGAVADFEVDFFYEAMDSKNTYSLKRTDYTPGTGCDDTPVLMVTQTGTLIKTGVNTAVSNGISVELTPTTMTITPFTAEIVSRLVGVCACGVTWTVGQAQTFTGPCPANTCTDTSWLRQPVGGPAYGSMRHYGESLRMTEFDADMATGYQNDLQPYDYALTQLDSEPCEPAWPVLPVPPGQVHEGKIELRCGGFEFDNKEIDDDYQSDDLDFEGLWGNLLSGDICFAPEFNRAFKLEGTKYELTCLGRELFDLHNHFGYRGDVPSKWDVGYDTMAGGAKDIYDEYWTRSDMMEQNPSFFHAIAFDSTAAKNDYYDEVTDCIATVLQMNSVLRQHQLPVAETGSNPGESMKTKSHNFEFSCKRNMQRAAIVPVSRSCYEYNNAYGYYDQVGLLTPAQTECVCNTALPGLIKFLEDYGGNPVHPYNTNRRAGRTVVAISLISIALVLGCLLFGMWQRGYLGCCGCKERGANFKSMKNQLPNPVYNGAGNNSDSDDDLLQ